MITRKFTSETITELNENQIFVFGSNGNGNHAGGAAWLAVDKFGAIQGQARGLQGSSYAIETLNKDMNKVSLSDIDSQVSELSTFASHNPQLEFIVTKIGLGIAGFTESEIAPIFKRINFPSNVTLPIQFCVTKGYKVFDPNWSCRGKKYEVGGTYIEDLMPKTCAKGIHFCEKLVDCYDYYGYDKNNKVAEVECLGITNTDDGKKFATNSLKIVREVLWSDVDGIVNIGIGNTGRGNSGDLNSGDLNSGYRNSGDLNSGDLNSGDLNSGDLNSGYRNSGDLNSGYRNSGDLNSGDRNSGDLNSGDLNSGYRNSGVFCTKQKNDTIIIFDSPSNMTWDEWYNSRVYSLCLKLTITEWIDWDNMSEQEKTSNPKAYVCGGYVKTYSYKEAWANLWNTFSEYDKLEFKKLPNWDTDKFEFITGIKFE